MEEDIWPNVNSWSTYLQSRACLLHTHAYIRALTHTCTMNTIRVYDQHKLGLLSCTLSFRKLMLDFLNLPTRMSGEVSEAVWHIVP